MVCGEWRDGAWPSTTVIWAYLSYRYKHGAGREDLGSYFANLVSVLNWQRRKQPNVGNASANVVISNRRYPTSKHAVLIIGTNGATKQKRALEAAGDCQLALWRDPMAWQGMAWQVMSGAAH